jgi:hypothetical protein
MKVIVAGSRIIDKFGDVCTAIQNSKYEITEVVSGCARGADSLGEHYALVNDLPVKKFPASWDKHGRQAGILRNTEMADYADAAIVVWDGVSNGSKHMIAEMKKRNKPVFVHVVLTEEFVKSIQ